MNRLRFGYTLFELVVALPVVALLTAVAVHLLLSVHRNVLAMDGALSATRELRHGTNVLAAEWRGIRANDIVAWTDTSLEFDATVGVGVVCTSRVPNVAVSVVGVDPQMAPSASPQAFSWNQPLQAGDRALIWLAGREPLDSIRIAEVRVASAVTSTDCSVSPLLAGANRTTLRLNLSDSLAATPVTGAPIRIVRRTRYSLYKSGDGDWYLGRRTRGTAGWDVVQPVAGPLLAPGEKGLHIAVFDSVGRPLNSPVPPLLFGATRARISAQLRAPRRSGRARTTVVRHDSLSVHVHVRATRRAVP